MPVPVGDLTRLVSWGRFSLWTRFLAPVPVGHFEFDPPLERLSFVASVFLELLLFVIKLLHSESELLCILQLGPACTISDTDIKKSRANGHSQVLIRKKNETHQGIGTYFR